MKIAIVGNPNVGKSVMFNNLTGVYATVSNYPGTTVEVSRGRTKIAAENFEVVDTPGMYSLLPITEEERVARSILLQERPDIILHVIDAKNMDRMLAFTFQLMEADLPVILVLNMMDEAEKIGLKVGVEKLGKELQIPVVATVSTTGKGMKTLKEEIRRYARVRGEEVRRENKDAPPLEAASDKIESLLQEEYLLSKRAIALLLLQDDEEVAEIVREKEMSRFDEIKKIVEYTKQSYDQPLDYIITMRRQEKVNEIAKRVIDHDPGAQITFRERLSRITMNPATGLPILLLVLYLGLYKFVGGFGAGMLVDFLESVIFGEYINPFATKIVLAVIPWQIVQDLFVGEFGIVTLGTRYAVAIILPIVALFFLVFAIIEDSGYLPRLAMLIDKIFKNIGLSGRAIIPMVLGFGCATMATMVTRTLPTKRERVISTVLLSLAIPCSAQLGVILALLEGKEASMLVWAGVIAGVFLFIGYLTAKLLPGDAPSFYMELPPLRLPKLSNVLMKTYTRVQWYFKEIMPLFILASFCIWVGQVTKLFDVFINLLKGPVRLIGLPPEAARVFLLGFFRRDYGAAGLYDLNKTGILSGGQLVVACVALTLFLPCIAQFLITVKERGIKTGVVISVFILFFSFSVAFVVNLLLSKTGMVL